MINLKVDASQFVRMGNVFAAIGKRAPLAMIRAVNHTGAKALTGMRRAMVPQTGLQMKTIRKALKGTKAFNGGAYVIRSAGGNVRLQFFKARETRKGVSAVPWNNRRVYAKTFMKGGQFPKRAGLVAGGAVVHRVGAGRYPLKSDKSGLFIPEEMVSGNTEATFYRIAEAELPGRIAHEIYRILG